MASLRDEARPYLEDFRDAISWLVVWKTGRGWNIRLMWNTEYTEGNASWHQEAKWDIDEEDQELLRHIMACDPNACLVNGYYMNIGPINEEMTLGTLIDGLRFQYEGGGNVAQILEMCEAQKERKSMSKLEAVLDGFRNDQSWNTPNPDGSRRFDKEIAWIESMVKSYAETLKMEPDEVIEIMEAHRNYSWPNYYQEANFPGIGAEAVYGVFENADSFRAYVHEHWAGFKCPKCGDVSPNPEECIHRVKKDGVCDWCSYGLFRAPKGVIIKTKGLGLIPIFEPVAKERV